MEEIKENIKVLWLASWYPGEYEHTNGDFVQRHAQAVAKFINLDVIHVAQAGGDIATKENLTVSMHGQLTEYNYSFDHQPASLDLLNKVLYNLRYIRFYKKILKEYILKHGKPTIVHVHAPMKAGLLALWLKKKYGISYIVTEHSSMYDSQAVDNFYKRSGYFRRNTARVFKGALKVTCVSDTIGQLIKNIFNLSSVDVIHNVVKTDKFYPSFIETVTDKPFVWIHVSSMYKLKNVEGILEAASRLNDITRNWQLRLVGPPNDTIKRLVQKTRLTDKVVFVGELTYAEVATEIRLANAMIMFSRHENFPCVISEALCCGVPVLSSDVGGIHEALNESNGILVPSENVEVLAHAMQVMMKNYVMYNKQTIAEKAMLSYSEDTIGKQFIDLY